jgi:hypothetical protein
MKMPKMEVFDDNNLEHAEHLLCWDWFNVEDFPETAWERHWRMKEEYAKAQEDLEAIAE